MRTRLLVIIAVLSLVLAGCGGSESTTESVGGEEAAADTESVPSPTQNGNGSPSSAEDAEPVGDPIRVLYSPNSEQLALFVADAAGLFKDRELNVQLEEAVQIEPALLGGTGEMGLSTAPDVLTASQEGLDLIFATGGSVNTPENPRLFLVASKTSGIDDVSDLAGKRVGVISRGSFAELGVAILMEEQGVDLDTISWVEMPFPQMNDALNEEVIDAAVAVVPFTSFMEANGHTPLIDVSDLAPRALIAILTARRDWAEAHAEEVVAFREALAEAAELIEEDPEFAKEVEVEYTGLPPEIVEQIPFSTFASQVTEDEVRVWIDIMESQGLLEPGLDAVNLIVPPPGA